MRVLVTILACLVLGATIAYATHPGPSASYKILGFTPDGKYVLFQKDADEVLYQEEWIAIYDARTARLATSQPMFRNCTEREELDPGTCPDKVRPIDRKSGERTRTQLFAKYGAPTGSKVSGARPDASITAGFVQTFTAGTATVQVKVKATGKLPALGADDGTRKSVPLDLEISTTVNKTTWSVKKRIYGEAVPDSWNANVLVWPELHVQELAVSPDHRTVALVFARKPYVIVQPATPAQASPGGFRCEERWCGSRQACVTAIGGMPARGNDGKLTNKARSSSDCEDIPASCGRKPTCGCLPPKSRDDCRDEGGHLYVRKAYK